MRFIYTFFTILNLTYLVGCGPKDKGQSDLKTSFDKCAALPDNSDLITYSLTDMKFRIPKDWKVRRNEKLNGIECMDTVSASKDLKIRTFNIYEFDSQNTDLQEYFKSQLKMIDESSMTIMETGTKLIGKANSYYVVTLDTVDNFPINQVYFFTDYLNKRYTTQIATSATAQPVDEICKSIWLVEGIELSKE